MAEIHKIEDSVTQWVSSWVYPTLDMATHANKRRNIMSQPSQNKHEDTDSMEKDATELELEKLVFGDEKGFHDNLKLHKQINSPQNSSIAEKTQEKGQEEADNEGLEGLEDSAVRAVDPLLGKLRG